MKPQRLIDADAVEKVLTELYIKRPLDSDRWVIADIKKGIMDLPTIDAVPVIRCKDCKHHGEQYGNGYCMKDGCYGWSDEDYCSRAERRGEHDTAD